MDNNYKNMWTVQKKIWLHGNFILKKGQYKN